MPLVKMTEAKELKFTKGSTCYPVLEVIKWVDKPDCLKDGAAAGIALDEPAPVQAQHTTSKRSTWLRRLIL